MAEQTNGRKFASYHGGEYLGTYFGCDAEVVGTSHPSISAQYAEEVSSYGSHAVWLTESQIRGNIFIPEQDRSIPYCEYLFSDLSPAWAKALVMGLAVLGARRANDEQVDRLCRARTIIDHLRREFSSGWDKVDGDDEISTGSQSGQLRDLVDEWIALDRKLEDQRRSHI